MSDPAIDFEINGFKAVLDRYEFIIVSDALRRFMHDAEEAGAIPGAAPGGVSEPVRRCYADLIPLAIFVSESRP